MERKHTPGPWEIYDEEFDDRRGYQEPKIIANGSDSALVHEICTIRIGLKETPANARLIAAAPDLLAACQLALDTMSDYRNNTPADVQQFIRAAISKAEGQIEVSK